MGLDTEEACLWGWWGHTQAEFYDPSVRVGGKTEPSGCHWGRPEQAIGDNGDERCCHGVEASGLHTSKYGSGEVGTTTTLHLSRGGWDEMKWNEMRWKNRDVLKMLQLISVKSHPVQAALHQEPSSQLMKHTLTGSQEETKSHFWQGGRDRVMWEWILCKWHILPFCGFWIMKNSKDIRHQISSANNFYSSHTKCVEETCERDTVAFPPDFLLLSSCLLLLVLIKLVYILYRDGKAGLWGGGSPNQKYLFSVRGRKKKIWHQPKKLQENWSFEKTSAGISSKHIWLWLTGPVRHVTVWHPHHSLGQEGEFKVAKFQNKKDPKQCSGPNASESQVCMSLLLPGTGNLVHNFINIIN